jgi:hypothetical protein
LIHAKPYTPQGKGKIERWFKTVRGSFLPLFKGSGLGQLNAALTRWIIESYLPMILAGQNNLVDKLSYRSSQPLASRIVARSHLQATTLDAMNTYLEHRLAIAGVEHNLFDQPALTAIHQGAGGLFRKANHLARGALIAAAANNKPMVNAEHVQLAATEIF